MVIEAEHDPADLHGIRRLRSLLKRLLRSHKLKCLGHSEGIPMRKTRTKQSVAIRQAERFIAEAKKRKSAKPIAQSIGLHNKAK